MLPTLSTRVRVYAGAVFAVLAVLIPVSGYVSQDQARLGVALCVVILLLLVGPPIVRHYFPRVTISTTAPPAVVAWRQRRKAKHREMGRVEGSGLAMAYVQQEHTDVGIRGELGVPLVELVDLAEGKTSLERSQFLAPFIGKTTLVKSRVSDVVQIEGDIELVCFRNAFAPFILRARFTNGEEADRASVRRPGDLVEIWGHLAAIRLTMPEREVDLADCELRSIVSANQ
jgi:hypothetical protein